MKYIFFFLTIIGISVWMFRYWQTTLFFPNEGGFSEDVVLEQLNLDHDTLSESLSHATNPSDTGTIFPQDRITERVTKKPFGIFIDSKVSPVQPERFRGYHTGVDFETFDEEATINIPVRAICDGEILEQRFVSGYGGVVVTSCAFDHQPVTVVYGHLAPTSFLLEIGNSIREGEELGMLGMGGSRETDGERKHLHLGVHRGSVIDLRGYVPTERELAQWINPTLLFR